MGPLRPPLPPLQSHFGEMVEFCILTKEIAFIYFSIFIH